MGDGDEVRNVSVRLERGESYPIEIGAGALGRLGEVARARLSPHARRVALVSNARVFGLYGARAVESLRGAGYEVSHWLMGEGERFKTWRTAERALRFLSDAKIERSDAVMALGGGVVGDLAGFAAALYLRGVAFVQVPTTLLAQVDSSVGGKTGVNTAAGKNLVGAFHHPRAVVIDTETLRTLPRRELTAGWCEAIKHGAAGDAKLFRLTVDYLARAARVGETVDESRADESRLNESRQHENRGDEGSGVKEDGGSAGGGELARLVAAQCAFKAKIVGGDEREDVNRTDARSRRILNFGHTVGHALEALTRYRRFRHGEAVGHGMVAAAEVSKRLGLLAASELESLRAAVVLAGPLPRADDIAEEEIERALRTDKKSVGGIVRWVLLEGLGRARVVDGGEVTARVLRDSLRAALRETPK